MTEAFDTDTEPVLNIVGDLVALGPCRRDLLPIYWRWRNDWSAMQHLIPLDPVTLEAETARYERLQTADETVRFTIYDRASLQPIGITALDNVDYRNQTAEFSIVIGEAEFRHRGYGTETTRLMLDYAFTALGLHNLMLRVFAFNPAGLRAYQKAGFREYARRRESVWHNGRFWDTILMDCLADEFESPVLARVLSPDVPRS